MSTITPGTNVSVLAGTLARPPEHRELPSGTTLLALEVRLPVEGGPPETVPVTWLDPPARAAAWAEGEPVVVLGRVRRRFFRSGGVTQARTDVLAREVVPSRQRARVGRLAADACQLVAPAPGPGS